MLENMEWYRVFYFTAKAGSFSRAAEELYITQPAVSHSIKQLELKLGGKLFFRTSKGATLTAEGEVLFKYVEQAYNFMTAAENKIAEMHQLMSGEIKIGASDTLCKHYLLPYLEQFHQSYPDIRIQVTNRTTRETVNLLKEGKIDFGVVNLPIEDKQLHIRESTPIQDCFVAGVKYQDLTASPIPLDELLNYPIILLEKGSSTRSYVDRYAALQGLTIHPEIELGSVDLLVQFARSGLGISCVIENFIAEELAQGTLFIIKLKEPIPPRRIGLITLNEVPLSAAANHFLQCLP